MRLLNGVVGEDVLMMICEELKQECVCDANLMNKLRWWWWGGFGGMVGWDDG